jgi:carboxymethylenebutenolidase
MGEWIDLEEADRPRAWLARPASGDGPGVIILHAWWGLNETIRRYADRLAGEGFVAIAPDLYGGTVVDTIEDAEHAVDSRPAAERRPVVDAAVARLRSDDGELGRGIGVVAFSMGCSYALALAAEDEAVDAVVLHYGTGELLDWSRSRAAFLGHFAENDPFEEPEYVAALQRSLAAAGREARFETYAGTGHWFVEPDRPEYDARAAETAWQRTVAFLRENLGPLGA